MAMVRSGVSDLLVEKNEVLRKTADLSQLADTDYHK